MTNAKLCFLLCCFIEFALSGDKAMWHILISVTRSKITHLKHLICSTLQLSFQNCFHENVCFIIPLSFYYTFITSFPLKWMSTILPPSYFHFIVKGCGMGHENVCFIIPLSFYYTFITSFPLKWMSTILPPSYFHFIVKFPQKQVSLKFCVYHSFERSKPT